MNKKLVSLCVFGTVTALAFSLLAGCTFKSNATPSPEASVSPSPAEVTASPSATPSVTKDDISSSLKTYGDNAIDIAWSPDDSAVAFIKLEGDASNIYVWKIGEADAKLVSVAEPTTDGFSWSPSSKYFLVNVGHMGPGTITSTLIDAESLEVVIADITTVSISPPVWSADSRFLALSTDTDNGAVEITAFDVASKTSVSLAKATNTYGPYVVESWGEDNIIKYTEMTSTGNRVEKTIEIGE